MDAWMTMNVGLEHVAGLLAPSMLAASFWTTPSSYLAIAGAVIGLGFVIFIHELGHFLVAKMCGVKCEKFYVGFDVPIKIGPIKLPPRICKFQWGETEYGIGIIPLGGYVKMLGQDDNPANAAKENERIRKGSGEGSGVGGQGSGNEGDAAAAGGETNYQLDPRSYPAKAVWKRMLIISAGVTANVISAVFFAAIAYAMGVPYQPTEVGAALPGGPAWKAGIQPRDLYVGTEGSEPNEQLRFDHDLRQNVAMHGYDRELPMLIKRGDSEPMVITVRTMTKAEGERYGLPTIGILGNSDLVFAQPALQHVAGKMTSKTKFEPGDRIVEVKLGEETLRVKSYPQLAEIMAQHPNETISFGVITNDERENIEKEWRERVKQALASEPPGEVAPIEWPQASQWVTMEPLAMRTLGIQFALGPIVGVRPDSVAAKANIKEGERIAAIDGEPTPDAFAADRLLQNRVGQPTELTLEGAKGQSRTVTITPEGAPYLVLPGPGSPLDLPTLGVVCKVDPKVIGVEPGSPADKAGIQAGDELAKAKAIAADNFEELDYPVSRYNFEKEVPFGDDKDSTTVPGYFLRNMQFAPDGTKLVLTWKRGDKIESATLAPVAATDWNNADRGMVLKPVSRIRQAQSFGEAMYLGVRETGEGVMRVVMFLKKLVFGEVAITNLGGPGTIAFVATSEATLGIPRLLIFLTLLSANLAVVNMLPIPVLDGGHLVFLAYEGITGKPANENVAMWLSLLGLAMLLSLMLFVISLDIYRFVPYMLGY